MLFIIVIAVPKTLYTQQQKKRPYYEIDSYIHIYPERLYECLCKLWIW